MSEHPATRTWLPSAWLDECIPAPQADANAFIHRRKDGTYFLRPIDDTYDDEFWRTDIEPGQIVELSACDDYGHAVLTIAADGTWSLDRPTPQGAKQFWIVGDADTMSGSIDELVTNLEEPIDAGDYTIGMYNWEHSASFRFEVGPGIKPRLVMCAGAS